ncbi:hypothetical protein MPEAHAMD_4485 [Methylobacterium frigidaeris]|uniref:Major facilitator superfamily (MFS) profile domain-containing protein n=1 Tax=Methylobacterium frigidaeris TaxID=2038277 RepID=A0AA37HEJ2_9HYPH|nr:hypothetical protein MPEAHAMD_4485 [Methylobacterium frigidaeris]
MVLFAFGNGLSALAPSYGWMLAFRFLAGLPHGAYFGVASLSPPLWSRASSGPRPCRA